MDYTTVDAQITEISSFRRQVTAWRIGQILVLTIVIVTCVFQLWSAVAGLTKEGPKRDEFATQVGGSMQDDILPRLQAIGAEAVKSIDFNQQIALLNKRAPDVANATLAESRQLGRNLQQRGQNVLKTQFEQALESKADELQQAFPDVDPEQLTAFLGELTGETQLQVTDVTASLFIPHIESMNTMLDDIDSIKMSEKIPADADLPTWEVAFLFIDIARADFTFDEKSTSVTATPNAVTPKAKAPKTGKEKK
jgi:hypothetical protein